MDVAKCCHLSGNLLDTENGVETRLQMQGYLMILCQLRDSDYIRSTEKDTFVSYQFVRLKYLPNYV